MKQPSRKICSKVWWLAAAVAFLCGVLFAPAQITITPPDGGTNGGTINTNATLDPTNAVLKNIITTLALTNFGRVIFVATNGNPASQGGMTPIDTVSNAVRVAKLTGIDTIIVLPGDHYYRAPTNSVQDAAIRISDYPGRLTIMGLGWNSRLWSDREGTCFVISNTGPVTIQDLNITGFRNTDVANVFGPGPGNGIAIDTKVGNIRIVNVRLSDFQRFGAGSFAFNSTQFTNDVIFSGCVASNCGSFFPTFLTGLNDGAGFVLGQNYTLDNCLIENCVKGIEIYGNDFGATNRPTAHVRVLNTRFKNIIGEHVFNGGYSNNMDVIFRNCSFIDTPGYVRYDGSNYITGGTPVMFSLSLMQNLQFDDNWVQPHYAVGLSIFANAQDNRGARVRRNKFYGMHNPIQAGDATGGTSPGMRDLIIEHNDFYDFGGRGIQLIGVRDSLIKNNRFFNGSTNGTLANIYIGGTAPAAHSSNILVEANQHFDFNTVPGNSYCLEIAAGTIDVKAVNNDWHSFATMPYLNGGTNTFIIGRDMQGIGIGTNDPNQRLVVAGNTITVGTNSAKKFHATDGSIPTNSIIYANNLTNFAALAFGPGLVVSNGFLIATNQGGTNVGGGSLSSSNVTLYGSFGHLSNTNPFVWTSPGAIPMLPLTNYSGFQGSNFTATAGDGWITNHMPSGFVDINATISIGDPDSLQEYWFAVFTNGVQTQLETFFLGQFSGGGDEYTMSMHGSVYLVTNATVYIGIKSTSGGNGIIINSHYLTVRSYDHRFTVVVSTPPGLIAAGDVGANTILVTNGISQIVTNLGNGKTVSMVWVGPDIIRWGPTNDGTLTGGGTAPQSGVDGPARTWTLEVYPGGYTNLTFPGAFTWIDGGPFYDPTRTNLFELKFTGSNFLAHSLPNGTLSAQSANISGRWIVPPAGIIGGPFNSQYRSNLTANALFTVSNLLHETELEIIANGPQAMILNSNSIVWMEGSEPFIPTNGRTLLRFWPAAGVTNGMVLSGQVFNLTNGTDISFVRDIPNKTITIHYTGSGGGGASLTVNADQFDFTGNVLTFKALAPTTNGISYGGKTVLPDPETGDAGSVAASYVSAKYMDIGVTNLGNGNVVSMVWNGPSLIRWWPTNNGTLTGGGTAPQSGDSARLWKIIIFGGATNITWPGAFQWTDGGPLYDFNRTNVYEIQFTTSNYLARRIAPSSTVQPTAIREEFIGGNNTSGQIGTHGWKNSQAIVTTTSSAGHPGIVSLQTTSALTNSPNLTLGHEAIAFGPSITNVPFTNKWVFRFNTANFLSNSTVRIGLTDGLVFNIDPANGLYFAATNTASTPGNWFGVLSAGGTQTIIDTGISAGTVNWITNEVRCTGNGQVSFAVNGTATSPIGGGPSSGVRASASITKTEASIDTGVKQLDIDAFYHLQPFLH